MTCGNGKLILEDKFETLDPAWGFGEQDSTRSNGPEGLVYNLQPDDTFHALNGSGIYDNYEVCAVFTTKVPADANAYVSVNFWASDSDNRYGADVFPALGTFDVYRIQKKKYLTPVSAKSNPAISKGTDVTNEISVTVNGNNGTLAINGKKITEFTGQPPEGGSQFGFDIGAGKTDAGPSTLILKNIQLREIGSTPTAVGENACLDKCQADLNACGTTKCGQKQVACLANCKDTQCTHDCLIATMSCVKQECFAKTTACRSACGQ
jgi:hypothetical protein